MIISCVIVFVLCWLLIYVILIIKNFIDFEVMIGFIVVMMFVNCFVYINSCINLILYFFLFEKF